MTTIFSVICGKYDESQDLENDFKDKHGPLNKHVFFVKIFFHFFFEYLSKVFILFKE
jgi:hypothetical protein